MKFSKKKFEEEYIPEEEQVDELFSLDGEFGGDVPHKPHSEIKTDTQKSFDDTSDFEPAVPQTGDDFASKTKNRSNWYGMTNMGQPYGSGVNHAVYTENFIKERTKEMVKELINKRTDASEFVKNNRQSDVNRNSIPDIDELDNSVIISKTKGFVNSVNSNGLSGDEIGVVLDFILTNINLDEVPSDYKRMIQSKFR